MEALTKGISMGFALFLFVLAFLIAQEYTRKSEALLNRINELRNNQAVMSFWEEEWEEP